MLDVMLEDEAKSSEMTTRESHSLADLFQAASQELARSDARIYRSVDRHLTRMREILKREEADSTDPPLLKDPDEALQGPPSYERQTRKSLESLCRDYGVRGYSRMTKKDMIVRLKEEGVEAPPTPIEAFSKAELISLLRDVLPKQPHEG